MSPFSIMFLERAALVTVAAAVGGELLAVTEGDELGFELEIVEVIKVLGVTSIEVLDVVGTGTGVVVMDVVGVGVGVADMVVSGVVVADVVVSEAVVGMVVSEVVAVGRGTNVPRADVVNVVISGAEVVVPEIVGTIVSDVVLGPETGPGPNTMLRAVLNRRMSKKDLERLTRMKVRDFPPLH